MIKTIWLAALTLSVSAGATTWGVAPNGSDTAAGSEAAPFKTLQKAADVALAGDTIKVQAGTYAGMDLTGTAYPGGTVASPITFLGGSGVTINALPTKGLGYAMINIESNNGGYVIKGFRVIGGGSKAGIR